MTRTIDERELCWHEDAGLANWRDRAMSQALRGFDNCEHRDALLEAIATARPEEATLSVMVDRIPLVRFLHEECAGCRGLLSAEHTYRWSNRDESVYFGWYAVEWDGSTVEVALPPHMGVNADAVYIGRDLGALRALAAAFAAFARRLPVRSLRYCGGWQNAPEIDRAIGSVVWDDLVLEERLLRRIRDAIEGFAANREAYRRFGFAWRRGVLLIGPPGTGKTMVCKAAAASLPEFPFLYVRDMNDGDLREEAVRGIFRRARELAPCILAIEDLEGLVGSHNRTVFLNELDGFTNNDGVLVIASSNHPEKIDEALLRRPSRFDQVFHIGLPALEERRRFCRMALGREALSGRLAGDLDVERLAADIAERTEGFTPAYLKEALVSAALERAREGDLVLDGRYADAVRTQVEELKAHLKRTKDPSSLADMREFGALGFRE